MLPRLDVSRIFQQPNRVFGRRRAQVHVPLRRGQVRVAGQFLNGARDAWVCFACGCHDAVEVNLFGQIIDTFVIDTFDFALSAAAVHLGVEENKTQPREDSLMIWCE